MIGLMDIRISKAGYNDLESILELQKTAFLSEAGLYNNYQIEPLHQTLDSIKSDFETYTFLKAEYRDKVIGSVKAKVNDGYCWIGKLIVHPDFQRKGIGRRLLLEAESLFPEVKEFHLFTGSKSIGNISLYESIGYEKKEEFHDSKNPDVVLIKMVKEK